MESLLYSHSFELLFVLAIIVDFIIGDPKWFPHPVKIIGKLLTIYETFFRKFIPHTMTAGLFTVVIALATVCSVTFFTLKWAVQNNTLLANGLSVVLLYFSFALNDLIKHSMHVYYNLQDPNLLEKARVAVGYIVGRDTSDLTDIEISRACIETVSENMVDGITAPVFWAIVFSFFSPLFGLTPITWSAIGIIVYKTINTMDSMFGYKNDRYREFGYIPAKLDDLVNYVPSRLSGPCIAATAFILSENWRQSVQIYRKDRLSHSSPNAAHAESAVSGALGIQLGGESTYFGKIVKKPIIGTGLAAPVSSDILRVNKLVTVSSIIFVLLLLLTRAIFIVLM